MDKQTDRCYQLKVHNLRQNMPHLSPRFLSSSLALLTSTPSIHQDILPRLSGFIQKRILRNISSLLFFFQLFLLFWAVFFIHVDLQLESILQFVYFHLKFIVVILVLVSILENSSCGLKMKLPYHWMEGIPFNDTAHTHIHLRVLIAKRTIALTDPDPGWPFDPCHLPPNLVVCVRLKQSRRACEIRWRRYLIKEKCF